MEDRYVQQFKKGSLEMILLSLIGRKETYGYELIAALNASASVLGYAKEGTIYPILYRLQEGGLIRCRLRCRPRPSASVHRRRCRPTRRSIARQPQPGQPSAARGMRTAARRAPPAASILHSASSRPSFAAFRLHPCFFLCFQYNASAPAAQA